MNVCGLTVTIFSDSAADPPGVREKEWNDLVPATMVASDFRTLRGLDTFDFIRSELTVSCMTYCF